MAPDAETALAAAPVYDLSWIERYQAVEGGDARLVAAEMSAFRQLFDAEFSGVARRSIRHLDAGTCAGRYLRWGVGEGFGLVCGIDRSPSAAAFCARTVGHDRVHVYRADVLDESDLAATAGRHAPFRLVTMMLGTINHIDRGRHADLLRSFAGLMDPGGRLVLSSWRPGRCSLSLYGEPERRFLETSALDERRLAEIAGVSGLNLIRTVSTPWQLLAVLSPPAGRLRGAD
jgi:SAM-dependent methyltransferase